MISFLKKYPLVLLAVLLLLYSATGRASGATHFPDLATKRYKQAAAYYHNLLVHPFRAEQRGNWQRAAENFHRISREAGNRHSRTPDSLFMAAKIYRQMGERFGRRADFGRAVDFYQDLARRFPDHHLADDALMAIGRIMLVNLDSPSEAVSVFAGIITLFPDGDMQQVAARLIKKFNGKYGADQAVIQKKVQGKIQKNRITGR